MKIALIREEKSPPDRRVPLTPQQCKEVVGKFPKLELVVQKSSIRAISAQEYLEVGIPVVDDVSDADYLFGVKEVPIEHLIPNKTYFFFSHVIKKQEYNRSLLRAILKKNITLIDYEPLADKKGSRLVAFGRYAGIVGAYNGVRGYGIDKDLFDLKPAHLCYDMEEMKLEYAKVKLGAIKIAVTGSGRVSNGAMEVLEGMGIRKVSPQEYMSEVYDFPVYTQLSSEDYNRRKDGEPWDTSHWRKNPDQYESIFSPYTRETDLLIAAAFWHMRAPVLFTSEQMQSSDFRIKLIADITCDIKGSIPSTVRASTVASPFYAYDPKTGFEESFGTEGCIGVMAVDNLPCELPRNASRDFGKELVRHIIPALVHGDDKEVIHRATITRDGKLTPLFSYLQNYVDGKE